MCTGFALGSACRRRSTGQRRDPTVVMVAVCMNKSFFLFFSSVIHVRPMRRGVGNGFAVLVVYRFCFDHVPLCCSGLCSFWQGFMPILFPCHKIVSCYYVPMPTDLDRKYLGRMIFTLISSFSSSWRHLGSILLGFAPNDVLLHCA